MNTSDELIQTWINFSKFHNRITRALDQVLQQKYQLGLNEFYFLIFLNEAQENKLRLSELQKMVGLSQSALSRLVSRLEQHHLQVVERASFDQDKRSVYAVLTPSGGQYIVEIMKEINIVLEQSLSTKDIFNLKLFVE
ncbi:MarR family winged helix-turn-helix transcriptional regulator [Cytobacillus gottheilii]|uniref:MarR family transcriptional regulator n=1 Tax=Cytobacillus gottheilii TaxID=859144 RepID=A0ABX8FEZ9_9BACI|nr:MarR family transcriptional regulator [Cytobacillus gottheilii]QVY62564.1 MarR family transcriptional regulator [Cytobacillus gottheilii]